MCSGSIEIISISINEKSLKEIGERGLGTGKFSKWANSGFYKVDIILYCLSVYAYESIYEQ